MAYDTGLVLITMVVSTQWTWGKKFIHSSSTIMSRTAVLLTALASSSLAYVSLPINKDVAVEHRRRQTSNAANIAFNEGTDFNVSIGTPPQPIIWGIDTGSHLAVINGQNSSSCSTSECFDTTKSSTWVAQPGDCGEGFLGGGISSDTAFNSTDTVLIGGISVDDVPLCVNQGATGATGILGLNRDNSAWPDVLTRLRDGHIDRGSISIWLNERAAGSDAGEITFGGVDTARFDGGLTKMVWQSEADGSYNNLRAPFTGFGLTDAEGVSHSLTPPDYSGRAPGLDTGDPGISLPVDLYNALWSALGVVNSTSTGLKTVPCDVRDSPAKLTFTFGGSDGITFETPMSVWVADQWTEPIILDNGTQIPACKLNIDADPGDNGNLGTPLQQFMYNVWDYENNQVAMAKAVQGPPADAAVTPVPSGTDIPGVTSTATGTGVVVTTNSGKTIQTEPQVTTVVSGTTGLVYSTPLYDLGVGNPTSAAAAAATTSVQSSSMSSSFSDPPPPTLPSSVLLTSTYITSSSVSPVSSSASLSSLASYRSHYHHYSYGGYSNEWQLIEAEVQELERKIHSL